MSAPESTSANITSNNSPNNSSATRDQEQRSWRGNKNGGNGNTGRGGSRKNKRKDLGRAEWSRTRNVDRRARNETEQASKKQRLEGGDSAPIYSTNFSKEEITSEDRRPKRKVAVLIGYSGSGYKGMQLNSKEKTIEGDLFKAFVAAGAISKANADDPKKSSLVRCARTDKGVHAAGNIISLKLIIEDPDIVKKINDSLAPQIRVWGIERTNGAFSCYQTCESRVYEYLIPTHCFLPPYPNSFLGKKLVELAEEAGDLEGYHQRQEEVASFWPETEENVIKPILDSLDDQTRAAVLKALNDESDESGNPGSIEAEETPQSSNNTSSPVEAISESKQATATEATSTTQEPKVDDSTPLDTPNSATGKTTNSSSTSQKDPIREIIKRLKIAIVAAKRTYRIPPSRLDRIKHALSLYTGTHNYHNFTVSKPFKDPSANRVIKSFIVSKDPVLINGTEWLSLMVHGQSFMMHQIRKMVGMASLVVRCGCVPERVVDSYGSTKISIPKAPGLGLWLERPHFDSYNVRAVKDYGRNPIDFSNYKEEIEAFKAREIYQRIYETEEETNAFGNFFAMVDLFRGSEFLWLSSKGMEAARKWNQGEEELSTDVDAESEANDEVDGNKES
ncbi:MAG: tRNA pseudouridine synthase 1 [Cirrosporium novae-zelandiae]|nr:MAG: tRNA pseudouridine synthase 1 [Cirrosporium novae-zelandiae]